MDKYTAKNRLLNRKTVFYILTFLVLAFIWSNSLDDPGKSYAKSNRVLEFVSKVLAHIFGQDHFITTFFIAHVRKIAHFTEYMLLGTVVTAGMKLADKTRLQHLYNSLSFAVITAVIDEYIQIYTYRGSSVRDVIIDFSGYFIGTLLTSFIIISNILVRMIKNRDKEY